MPKALLDELRVSALRREQARAGVPQVVEAETGLVREGSVNGGLEGPLVEEVVSERSAAWRGKDEHVRPSTAGGGNVGQVLVEESDEELRQRDGPVRVGFGRADEQALVLGREMGAVNLLQGLVDVEPAMEEVVAYAVSLVLLDLAVLLPGALDSTLHGWVLRIGIQALIVWRLWNHSPFAWFVALAFAVLTVLSMFLWGGPMDASLIVLLGASLAQAAVLCTKQVFTFVWRPQT